MVCLRCQSSCTVRGGEGKLSCFVVGGGGWGWSGTGLWSPACGHRLRQSAEHLSVGWVLLGLVKLKMLVEVMAVSISRAFECWPVSQVTSIGLKCLG